MMIKAIVSLSVIKNILDLLEVDTLLGDSSKARKELNWKPKYDITN